MDGRDLRTTGDVGQPDAGCEDLSSEDVREIPAWEPDGWVWVDRKRPMLGGIAQPGLEQLTVNQ